MIEVTDLSKSFHTDDDGKISVLKHVSLTVEAGRLFTLLGPSGCGKSTLLRCIAGLETPDSGEIRIGGKVVFSSALGVNIPAHHRQIGMVFQSYAIWPHMSVFQNVAFPLEVRRERNVRPAVEEALALVGLADYGKRSATKLSGGQQQRVALARALVSRPDLLLLDEPLSNLDANLREQLRGELRRIKEAVGMTTLFVTHDQTEALALSDWIAVVDRGLILEVGRPEELYETPTRRFTAGFLGSANVIAATATESGQVESAIGRIEISRKTEAPATSIVAVGVRPERIGLLPPGAPEGARNAFPARVVSRIYLGQHVELTLKVGEAPPIRSLLPLERAAVGVGDEVLLSFAPEHAIPLAG